MADINHFLNTIHLGDSIELMKNLPKEKIDLILTDPPYNASDGGINLPKNTTGGPYYKVNEEWDKFGVFENYLDFTKNWTKVADSTLKPNGAILVCCSFHNIGEIILSLKELNYKFLNIVTWKKTNPMPNITKRTLTHSTEFVLWFAKSKGWTFNYADMKKYNDGKQLRDIWEFPLCQGTERIKSSNGRAAHPTQKPLELFKRLIEMSSKKGDIILDPFVGTGTTAIASMALDRRWIGIDNNSFYVEIANKRIKEYENINNIE